MRKKILSIVLTIAILALIILPVFHSASAYSRTCYDPLGGFCSYCIPCIIPPGTPGGIPATGFCLWNPLTGIGSCDGSAVGPCMAGC